jgi:hypothetical protein
MELPGPSFLPPSVWVCLPALHLPAFPAPVCRLSVCCLHACSASVCLFSICHSMSAELRIHCLSSTCWCQPAFIRLSACSLSASACLSRISPPTHRLLLLSALRLQLSACLFCAHCYLLVYVGVCLHALRLPTPSASIWHSSLRLSVCPPFVSSLSSICLTAPRLSACPA